MCVRVLGSIWVAAFFLSISVSSGSSNVSYKMLPMFRLRRPAQSVCLRSGLNLGRGIFPVNFRIVTDMRFDCAGSLKVGVRVLGSIWAGTFFRYISVSNGSSNVCFEMLICISTAQARTKWGFPSSSSISSSSSSSTSMLPLP